MKEQIESLATFICDTCRERTRCENTYPCAMADIVAKAIIKAGWTKQSEWISVKDRLPDREGTYLVCTFKGARKFGVYGRYCVRDKPQFDYDVTHWMPLPEPPEMKGGE